MYGSHAKDQKRKGQKIKKPFVKVKTQRQFKEDLGVTVERGAELKALFRCSIKLSFSLVATFLYQCEWKHVPVFSHMRLESNIWSQVVIEMHVIDST